MSNYNSTNCNEVKKEIMVTACAEKSQLLQGKVNFNNVLYLWRSKLHHVVSRLSPNHAILIPFQQNYPTKNLAVCLTTFTNITNISLASGVVPPDFKTSIIKSLLKTKTPLTLKN